MKRNRDVWKGLVAIEGIDGAGTTTLARNIRESLNAKGIAYDAGCEPTDGAVGRLIRRALSGEEKLSPESLALLFAADRREHVFGAGGIRETLDAGRIYLTDRYWFSSLAYQTLDCDWEWVEGLNAPYPLPGHLIFLALPVEEAQNRLSDRSGKEIFDAEGLQRRVADSYRRSIDAYADSGMEVFMADSTKAPETVCAEVLAFLDGLIDR